MAYSRLPNTVQAGRGLSQTPASTSTNPPGIVEVMLDTDIATTTTLGVVQVGSGLSITASGVLSTTITSSTIYPVKLTGVNYTATADDYYIGVTNKDTTITLPKGILGKSYAIKNQANGNVLVKGTGSEKIDGVSSQGLSTGKAIIVIFNGTQWDIIANVAM
jgi:hypothetical protein